MGRKKEPSPGVQAGRGKVQIEIAHFKSLPTANYNSFQRDIQEGSTSKRLTRQEAIRAKCLDCMCGSYKEVKLCPCSDCPLYRYRLGHEERDAMQDSCEKEDSKKAQ